MFEGKVALVTDAGRGIGRAIAKAFGNQRAHVIVNDIQAEKELTDIAGEISTAGIESIGIQADVTNSDQVKGMMQRTVQTFGRLDILVNNAGIIRRGTIETVSEKDWDQVIAVNLKGTFNCCHAAAKLMIKNRSGEILDVNGGILMD
jgi:3-oxoacyl-[acyl-carrier protein] reductase